MGGERANTEERWLLVSEKSGNKGLGGGSPPCSLKKQAGWGLGEGVCNPHPA